MRELFDDVIHVRHAAYGQLLRQTVVVQAGAAGENLHNEIRDVTIKSVFQDGVLGEICAAKEVSGHEA